MQPLRFGILGAAQIARKLVPAMRRAPGVVPVAVASRDAAKAAAFAREFRLEPVAGYDALLARGDVDAVYIPLPDGLHEEWTLRAAAAGKHVLCEKSLTASCASAGRMVAACRAAGVRLMEAFMFRFHRQHARVRELLAEELGAPLAYYARFGFHLDDPANIRLRRAWPAAASTMSAATASVARDWSSAASRPPSPRSSRWRRGTAWTPRATRCWNLTGPAAATWPLASSTISPAPTRSGRSRGS